ncbi:hypothetical protein Fmac_023385 [Flemingia macrophylla]|uniref:Uncharacterized protein n=1 Tax=Flemingia macrophylla TaxID=520843 RepID=A0ABD1LLC4_9FABA
MHNVARLLLRSWWSIHTSLCQQLDAGLRVEADNKEDVESPKLESEWEPLSTKPPKLQNFASKCSKASPLLALITTMQRYFSLVTSKIGSLPALITTAQRHFFLVTTKLAFHLNLSPNMVVLTLLSPSNDALDVFTSLAALSTGHFSGTFVFALVVGFVTIYTASFALNPAPFVKDVLFYVYLTYDILPPIEIENGGGGLKRAKNGEKWVPGRVLTPSAKENQVLVP